MPDRKNEIQTSIIGVLKGLGYGSDPSETYQLISFVGLWQMLLSIPNDEFFDALRNIEGFEIVEHKIRLPTKLFV